MAARGVRDRDHHRRRVGRERRRRGGGQAARLPVGAPGGYDGHARGQRGHRLGEQVVGAHRRRPYVQQLEGRAPRSARTTAWRPSSAGSVCGWSRRWWAPRLSSRARQAAATERASGYGSPQQLAQALGVALEPGQAPQGLARLARGQRRGPARPAARPARRAARARPARRARRGARTRSTRPASWRPGGWRRAGRCRRSRPPRTGRGGWSARRGRRPRRPSCSARRAPRARVAARVEAHVASAAATLGKRARSDRAHVQPDRVGALLAHALAATASATWSRGASSSTKRSPLGVEQPRALAADRLGDQEALAPAVGDQRGGVELGELEVGQRGARGERQAEPGAHRSRRVGGARPQRRRAAGGQHRAARGHVPRLAVASRRCDARRSARRGTTARRPRRARALRCGRRWRPGRTARESRAGRWSCRRRAPPAAASGRPPGPGRGRRSGRSRSARPGSPGGRPGRATPRTARARRSGRPLSRPAASVSAWCSSGESSSASAAAMPPWAQ